MALYNRSNPNLIHLIGQIGSGKNWGYVQKDGAKSLGLVNVDDLLEKIERASSKTAECHLEKNAFLATAGKIFSPLMKNTATRRIITNAGVGAGIGSVGALATAPADGSQGLIGRAVKGGLMGGAVGGAVGYGRLFNQGLKAGGGQSMAQAFTRVNQRVGAGFQRFGTGVKGMWNGMPKQASDKGSLVGVGAGLGASIRRAPRSQP